MATIRKRGNTYQIRVSLGYDVFGNQLTKTMTFKPLPNMTEKQLKKELDRQAVLFEEKCKTGQIMNGNIKLADFIEKWFTDYAETQLKKRTVSHYKSLLPRIIPALGHIHIDKIQPHHLLEFYNNLSESGVRQNTTYKPIKNFREILQKNGMTQKALAEKANVSVNTIASCVAGRTISNKTAERILKILPDTLQEVGKDIPLSPKTVRHYHRLLSVMLNTAVIWQLIPSNPCARVKPPKADKKEAVYLDEIQAAELINALDSEPLRYKTIVMLLLYSGMRRGELCGLEWSDIDFDRNLISISKSRLYLPEFGVYNDTTKNKSSERVIRIPQAMTELLKIYKTFQIEEQLKHGDQWHENNNVFKAVDGRPIHPDVITSWFHSFVKKNNLPPICIHSLRHTNATLLIASGTNIRTVANRLGHSTPTTTGNIYAHAIKTADEAAADALNDILNPMQKQKKINA